MNQQSRDRRAYLRRVKRVKLLLYRSLLTFCCNIALAIE